MRILIFFILSGIIISCSESTRFRSVTSAHTGINFSNTIVETDSLNVLSYEYIYNGAGVGIGDLNNDGLQDIVFAGNQVPSRVFLNEGDFRFRDITANFRGLTNDQWYSGVTIVDINNDGWPDVYLTSTADSLGVKSKNRLWISQGSESNDVPEFREMGEAYGVAESGQSVSAAFLDYDRDGDLDLYILNNTVTKRMNTYYRPKINDGTALNNDQLYRNNGDGTFTNVTVEAGIICEGFGLGLAIGDVNKDGYPDIYVSNDYISNDLLYINQGNGTFKNEIRKYLSYQTKSSMGNDLADVNNDGYPDIFTLDMMPESYARKKQTINGFSYRFYLNDEKYDFEHQYLRNMLHLHSGIAASRMIPFSEVGQMAGIYQTEWSWSPLFADYDNDGDKDLIVANGYPKDMTDKDWTRYQAAVYGSVAGADHVISMAPAVKVPNMAFENTGNAFFTKKEDWLPEIPSYSYGAAFVDLDNDGDLDYVANNLDDEAFVLRNYSVEKSPGKSRFIRLILIGDTCNTMAIGAKVELWSNGKYQFYEHSLSRGYASSVDPVVHFGLGENVLVDSLKVSWPASSKISILKKVSPGQTLELRFSEAHPNSPGSSVSTENGMLFSRADSLLDYTHQQSDFIDFFLNQNIIPHKFSQIGPAMAKGDLNMDGREDIIIGSSNTLPTSVYLRKGEGFEPAGMEGLTGLKEFSESSVTILDIDNDGDNDVVALAGGYENLEEEYHHYLYRNENGIFKRYDLPVPQFPASVVSPFDFDHDGDQDLFVGSRIKKGMYPYANHSWIVINNSGELTTAPWSRLNLGMVTDAVWSDYDGDGWEDLILTREWNSIAILKNREGKELVPQVLPEMDNYHGIWYSIVAGDFDNDGDDDYIAGNLGENHRFTVNAKFPMSLYAIDFENDGNIDPLITGYWKDRDGILKEYPVNYLDELWAQSTYFQKLFKDYSTFSYTTAAEILTKDILSRLDFKLFTNTTSHFVIWNNNGKFLFEKLPWQVQVSPVKEMIVRDFNNDGFLDILCGGNDYTYDIATGYYDSNKGLLLAGNGEKHSFTPVPPCESGILLQGMVESILCFDEDDSRLIVAGFNRAKSAVFRQMLK